MKKDILIRNVDSKVIKYEVRGLPKSIRDKINKYIKSNNKGITTHAGYIMADPRLKGL